MPERKDSVPRGAVPDPAVQRPAEYLVMPFIGRIKRGFFNSENASDVSNQLQAVINQQASRGWAFHSLEKVDVEVAPGCIPSLFGAKSSFITFDQLVFRRKETEPD